MPELANREDCPNVSVNEEDCGCGATNCDRHGFCCACIEYHRKNGGQPGCLN